jgi:hypothetical protein
MTNSSYQSSGSKFGPTPKFVAVALAASFAAACAFGTKLGLEVHTPFLGGVGNLGEEMVLNLPFGERRVVPFLCFCSNTHGKDCLQPVLTNSLHTYFLLHSTFLPCV